MLKLSTAEIIRDFKMNILIANDIFDSHLAIIHTEMTQISHKNMRRVSPAIRADPCLENFPFQQGKT